MVVLRGEVASYEKGTLAGAVKGVRDTPEGLRGYLLSGDAVKFYPREVLGRS
jgi:hypothetical protein